MSRHIFNTRSKGRRVRVVLGYDRVMDQFYFMVHRIDSPKPKGKRRSGRDSSPACLYTSTSDPLAGGDLDYFWDKLKTLRISVPAKVFREVDRDCEFQVGNRVVRHFANGKRVVLAR
jgi:hypothetical protein